IAERCLYGVDVNPMAVQLARLSLWVATLSSDRPLSFLDQHLATGDSVLGTWLPLLRQRPSIAGRRQPAGGSFALFDDQDVMGVMRLSLPARFSLAGMPSDTLDAVKNKERTLAALTRADSSLSRWKLVADVWCASWFAHGKERGLAAAF